MLVPVRGGGEARMPRIVVLATGGTISSRAGETGSIATDPVTALVDRMGPVPHGIVVEPVDILRLNSFNLSMADLRTIALAIAREAARADVDGVVVTHGTDTMEESAFLADLVHDSATPVVFTGAQRGADHPAPDGPDNIRDAVLVAADPAARGLGVLVVFGGAVFAARGVRKQHSIALAAFAARGGGPIGHVVQGSVRLTARPVRSPALAMPTEGFASIRTDIVVCYPGAGRVLFDAAVAAGACGVVVAGTGAGNPNGALVEAIASASERGVVVALATRVPEGPVLAIYGGGGAVDAVRAGAVPVGDLSAAQARVLLAVLLDRFAPAQARSRLAALSLSRKEDHR